MKISALKEYLEKSNTAYRKENQIRVISEREELSKKYPYSIVCEGDYPQLDATTRWCWQNIGPEDREKCVDYASEYPGCPLVLETEYIQHFTWGPNKEPGQEKCYKNPGEHGHEGDWYHFWLGKTGYDYGFCEFFFRKEEDLKKFTEAVEGIGYGENYE